MPRLFVLRLRREIQPGHVTRLRNIGAGYYQTSRPRADLMREAVERAERKQRHHQAIARILERRKNAPAVSEEDIRAAREEGRP